MDRRNARKTAPQRPKPRYRAPALEKGLEIIELLADLPEGLGQADVARSLQRTVGEIFRMLSCLVDHGYLAVTSPGDRYVLTPKLFALSHRHAPNHRLLAEALPHMKELAARVRQSCHLVVAYDGKGVVVAQADHPYEMGFAVRAGTAVDLLRSASGRILLAFQDEDDRARMLRETGAKPAAPETVRLLEDLQRIRERGFEDMESGRVRGVHDYSFPVLDVRGCATAAMTIPFIERLDRGEADGVADVRRLLGAAAARLTAALGGVSASLAPTAEVAETP